MRWARSAVRLAAVLRPWSASIWRLRHFCLESSAFLLGAPTLLPEKQLGGGFPLGIRLRVSAQDTERTEALVLNAYFPHDRSAPLICAMGLVREG